MAKRAAAERDQVNQPVTACSTDVRGSELETAQRDQGDGFRRRRGPSATLSRIARAKRAFLDDFSQWANITSAAQAAGIDRRTYYNWLEHDEAFALGARQASDAATERLEREAYRRAVEGSPYKRTSYWHGEPVGTDEKIEYSDQLMMLLLRARRPDLYREKVDLSVTSVVKTIAGVEPSSVL